MAGRILNRRELRKQAEQAQQSPPAPSDASGPEGPSGTKSGKTATPKRKPRAKKAPPRLRARWGVFDAGMKQVAIFDYNQHDAADAKVADLLAKKKGLYFLQIVKEPMPEPVPLEALPGR